MPLIRRHRSLHAATQFATPLEETWKNTTGPPKLHHSGRKRPKLAGITIIVILDNGLERSRNETKTCKGLLGFEEQGKGKHLGQESEPMVAGIAQKRRSSPQNRRDCHRSRGVSRCVRKWKTIVGFCRAWKQEENGVRTEAKGCRSRPESPVKACDRRGGCSTHRTTFLTSDHSDATWGL